MMETLKVSARSNPKAVAGALASALKEYPRTDVDVDAVGAGAVNQAVKALAIARGFLLPKGMEMVVAPSFTEIEIDGEVRTAMRFQVMIQA